MRRIGRRPKTDVRMSTDPSITMSSYFRLLRSNRNLRRLWLAQVISENGDWFYMVALYAMLLEFTGSAAALGFAFVLQVAPQALTGPMAGVINDRMSRKRVMIVSDVARFGIVGLMLLVRSPRMVWLVWPLLFAETVMWGLFEPARTAVIPRIVKEDELLVANTIASTTWSLNLFVGAALGGIAAVWLGRDAVIALDALSFLASVALVSGMRFDEPHVETAPRFRWRDLVDHSPLLEALQYVRTQPRLASLIFVKAGLGIAGTSWVIFPVLGRDVFPIHRAGSSVEQAGVLGMSLLMGARGLGSLLGPVLGAPWAQQRQNRLRGGIMAGFLLYGAGYVALSAIRSAPLAYVVVIVSHMGGAMVWVFSATLLQMITDDRYRGRVFSAELAFCTVMLGATAYGAGFLMDHGVGVRTVLLLTGVLTALAGLWWAAVGLRRERTLPHESA